MGDTAPCLEAREWCKLAADVRDSQGWAQVPEHPNGEMCQESIQVHADAPLSLTAPASPPLTAHPPFHPRRLPITSAYYLLLTAYYILLLLCFAATTTYIYCLLPYASPRQVQPCQWASDPTILGEAMYVLPSEVVESEFPYACSPGLVGSGSIQHQTSSMCKGEC